jgi:hypothetical protein
VHGRLCGSHRGGDCRLPFGEADKPFSPFFGVSRRSEAKGNRAECGDEEVISIRGFHNVSFHFRFSSRFPRGLSAHIW